MLRLPSLEASRASTPRSIRALAPWSEHLRLLAAQISALTIASSIFRSLSLGIPGPLALLHGFAELSIGEQDECPTPHESGTSNKATAPAATKPRL